MGQYVGAFVSGAGGSWLANWNPVTVELSTGMINRTDGSQLSGGQKAFYAPYE